MGDSGVGEWTVLHGGALGDLALTLHLALRLPGLERGGAIDVISRVDPGDLAACRPAIRRVSSDSVRAHWLFADSDDPPGEPLYDRLAGRRVLNMLTGIDSPLHVRLDRCDPQCVYSVDPRPQPESQSHIVTQWQNALEGQGLLFHKCIHQRKGTPHLDVPEALRTHGGEIFAEHGIHEPPALIHPGSGGRAKCWPLAGFLDVARRLRSNRIDVCFLIGPVELECWPDDQLDAIRNDYPLIECPRPNDLPAILAGTRGLLSNDCGPAHLAALLGTPTVTLFGTTSPAVWRPAGSQAAVLAGDPAQAGADWGISAARVVETLVSHMNSHP